MFADIIRLALVRQGFRAEDCCFLLHRYKGVLSSAAVSCFVLDDWLVLFAIYVMEMDPKLFRERIS